HGVPAHARVAEQRLAGRACRGEAGDGRVRVTKLDLAHGPDAVSPAQMDGPAGEGRDDRPAAAQPELVQPAAVTNAVARPRSREHKRRGSRGRGTWRARGSDDQGRRSRAVPAAPYRREG